MDLYELTIRKCITKAGCSSENLDSERAHVILSSVWPICIVCGTIKCMYTCYLSIKKKERKN